MTNNDYNLNKDIEEGLARAEKMLRRQRVAQTASILFSLVLIVLGTFFGYRNYQRARVERTASVQQLSETQTATAQSVLTATANANKTATAKALQMQVATPTQSPLKAEEAKVVIESHAPTRFGKAPLQVILSADLVSANGKTLCGSGKSCSYKWGIYRDEKYIASTTGEKFLDTFSQRGNYTIIATVCLNNNCKKEQINVRVE